MARRLALCLPRKIALFLPRFHHQARYEEAIIQRLVAYICEFRNASRMRGTIESVPTKSIETRLDLIREAHVSEPLCAT
jgi:hypothetical protein